MIRKKVDTDQNTVIFDFGDEQLVCSPTELSPEIVSRLTLHGLSQKIGDSYSGDRENAAEIASRTWQALKEGNWSLGGGGGGPRVTQLARALAAVTGKPVEEVAEKLAELDAADKKKIAAAPAVAAELARIKIADLEKKAAEAENAEDDGTLQELFA